MYPEFHSPVLQNTILELASSIEEDKVMLGVELWKRNQDRETTLKLFELFVEKKIALYFRLFRSPMEKNG